MRLIDAEELLAHRFVGVVGEEEKWSYMVGWNTAIEAVIENAPTIDAVPVVRCDSCKYHDDIDGYHACKKLRMRCPNDAGFFCKYGQRREDGDA